MAKPIKVMSSKSRWAVATSYLANYCFPADARPSYDELAELLRDYLKVPIEQVEAFVEECVDDSDFPAGLCDG